VGVIFFLKNKKYVLLLTLLVIKKIATPQGGYFLNFAGGC